MRLTRFARLAAAVSAVAILALSAADAQARSRGSRPLTVHKRSFLDTGKVVPVGSESRYVSDTVRYNRTSDYYSQRGKYGSETLPGPFDLPGR
jgi:hypothetical protein